MPQDLREFERAACEAAREAGKVLMRSFRRAQGFEIETKGLHDFVTEADHAAEEAAVGHIKARFPDHRVMSEEGAPRTAAASFRWVIDPLDGTTNFIHGVTPFSVSVALEHEASLLAGAVHDPYHDETFHAVRGGGAKLNGEPIACSGLETLDMALIATGFPFRELSRLEGYMKAFEACVRTTAGLRRAGSAAIDLAYTACGRYDGFWEIGLSRWDIAAGSLLVMEAGGLVTDVLDGQTYLDTGDIVAAGPTVHARLVGITKKAFG